MNNKIFEEKTLRAHFLTVAIYEVLKSIKGFKASSEKSVKAFFAQVLTYIVNHDSMGKFTTYAAARSAFAVYGINSAKDLVDAIIADKDSLAKLNYKVDKIKLASTSAVAYKSFAKKSHKGLDPIRTIVVRSKYGNYPVLFYENFEGVVTKNNKQMTLIKQDYHYATGCNYYQTRPILLSTWLELDPVRQNCTCVVDAQD